MDWLTFFSKVISTLAWPLLIGFVAWLFRRQLGGVLSGLTSFRGFGTEAKFNPLAVLRYAERTISSVTPRIERIEELTQQVDGSSSSSSPSSSSSASEELYDAADALKSELGIARKTIQLLSALFTESPELAIQVMCVLDFLAQRGACDQSTICDNLSFPRGNIQRALAWLTKSELITHEGGEYYPTDAGCDLWYAQTAQGQKNVTLP